MSSDEKRGARVSVVWVARLLVVLMVGLWYGWLIPQSQKVWKGDDTPGVTSALMYENRERAAVMLGIFALLATAVITIRLDVFEWLAHASIGNARAGWALAVLTWTAVAFFYLQTVVLNNNVTHTDLAHMSGGLFFASATVLTAMSVYVAWKTQRMPRLVDRAHVGVRVLLWLVMTVSMSRYAFMRPNYAMDQHLLINASLAFLCALVVDDQRGWHRDADVVKRASL